jgi:hypothetical protein
MPLIASLTICLTIVIIASMPSAISMPGPVLSNTMSAGLGINAHSRNKHSFKYKLSKHKFNHSPANKLADNRKLPN